jgi:hypothetical protein
MQTNTDPDRLRNLAAQFDCLTEEEYLLLANITSSTARTHRKRGTGPEYILAGNRYLYPRKALHAYLVSRTRTRRNVPVGDLL